MTSASKDIRDNGHDDWAVIVGIQVYPGLHDLLGPENDANAFHDWVRSPSGANVHKDRTFLIVSSQFEPPFQSVSQAKPTYDQLERTLLKLDEVAQDNRAAGRGRRVGRRLYLFFSGHGCAPEADESALLCADATRHRAGLHVAGRSWANFFSHSGYFEEVVLFMDCCREAFPSIPIRLPPLAHAIDPIAINRGRKFFGFATKWTSQAKETRFGNVTNGVFTFALLQGLGGKAADSDGRITARSLGNWLFNNMKEYLPAEHLNDPAVPREPDLVYDADGGANFVLVNAPRPRFLARLHIPADLVGRPVTVLNGNFKTVGHTDCVDAVWHVSNLSRGIYLAQASSGGWQVPFEVPGTGDVDVRF